MCPWTSFSQWKVSRVLYFTLRLLWPIPSPHCLCVLPARCKVVEGSGTGQAMRCEEVGSPRHHIEGNSYWLETVHWTTSRRNILFKKIFLHFCVYLLLERALTHEPNTVAHIHIQEMMNNGTGHSPMCLGKPLIILYFPEKINYGLHLMKLYPIIVIKEITPECYMKQTDASRVLFNLIVISSHS